MRVSDFWDYREAARGLGFFGSLALSAGLVAYAAWRLFT